MGSFGDRNKRFLLLSTVFLRCCTTSGADTCIYGQVRRLCVVLIISHFAEGMFDAARLREWRTAAMNFFRDRNLEAMIVDEDTFSLVFAVDGTTVTTTRPGDAALAAGAYSGYKGR